ncbi:MAG: hypothetical protein FIA97_14160 [Methylococcaceae bacterium]|nr:hypothetical protein [Methylococcaceae bacterium]
MWKTIVIAIALATLSGGVAAEPTPAPEAAPAAQTVRGRDLMTPDEWREHRKKLQSLATPAERQAYRAEHRKMLEARAKEKGLILRDGPGWRSGRMPGPKGGGAGGGAGQ